MTANELNSIYWDKRYQEGTTGWDLGTANPVLVDYVINNCARDIKILVPGAGKAHEVEALWKAGYTNVYAADIAPSAKKEFLKSVSDFPSENYLIADFFKLKDSFDLILEQTFFCAIDPELRTSYAKQVHRLLSKGGELYGLMFNKQMIDGPPFGGSIEEYKGIFSDFFTIKSMESTDKSVKPRLGNEIIIHLVK